MSLRINDDTIPIQDKTIRDAIRGNTDLMLFIKDILAEKYLDKIMLLVEKGQRSGIIDDTLTHDAIRKYFSVFSPIVGDGNFIHMPKTYQSSIFNLFMGGRIKDWYPKRTLYEKELQRTYTQQ